MDQRRGTTAAAPPGTTMYAAANGQSAMYAPFPAALYAAPGNGNPYLMQQHQQHHQHQHHHMTASAPPGTLLQQRQRHPQTAYSFSPAAAAAASGQSILPISALEYSAMIRQQQQQQQQHYQHMYGGTTSTSTSQHANPYAGFITTNPHHPSLMTAAAPTMMAYSSSPANAMITNSMLPATTRSGLTATAAAAATATATNPQAEAFRQRQTSNATTSTAATTNSNATTSNASRASKPEATAMEPSPQKSPQSKPSFDNQRNGEHHPDKQPKDGFELPDKHGYIFHPGCHDVLSGRDDVARDHPGNSKFCTWIDVHRHLYEREANRNKPVAALRLLLQWKREQSPPGRFLTKPPSFDSKAPANAWIEMSDDKALTKLSHMLRKNCPKQETNHVDLNASSSHSSQEAQETSQDGDKETKPGDHADNVIDIEDDDNDNHENVPERRPNDDQHSQQYAENVPSSGRKVSPSNSDTDDAMELEDSQLKSLHHDLPPRADESEVGHIETDHRTEGDGKRRVGRKPVALQNEALRRLQIEQESASKNGAVGEKVIDMPRVHDVLCGRGNGVNKHIGNIKFRSMLEAKQYLYKDASITNKPVVASNLVWKWKQLDPPGRFLQKSKDASSWTEMDIIQATLKVSKRLRDGIIQAQKDLQLAAEGKLKKKKYKMEAISPPNLAALAKNKAIMQSESNAEGRSDNGPSSNPPQLILSTQTSAASAPPADDSLKNEELRRHEMYLDEQKMRELKHFHAMREMESRSSLAMHNKNKEDAMVFTTMTHKRQLLVQHLIASKDFSVEKYQCLHDIQQVDVVIQQLRLRGINEESVHLLLHKQVVPVLTRESFGANGQPAQRMALVQDREQHVATSKDEKFKRSLATQVLATSEVTPRQRVEAPIAAPQKFSVAKPENDKNDDEEDHYANREDILRSSITKKDIVFSGDEEALNHEGNRLFGEVLGHYIETYNSSTRDGRFRIAMDIAVSWESQEPAGRFLILKAGSTIACLRLDLQDAIKKIQQVLEDMVVSTAAMTAVNAEQDAEQKRSSPPREESPDSNFPPNDAASPSLKRQRDNPASLDAENSEKKRYHQEDDLRRGCSDNEIVADVTPSMRNAPKEQKSDEANLLLNFQRKGDSSPRN